MWYARLAICGQRFRRAPAGDNDSSRPGKQSGLRVSGIARRRTEPGWRAAVLDERASRHALRLRGSEEGSGSRAPASASGASNARRRERRRSFLCERRRRRRISMFAPPICRRRWRNNAFPFRRLRRRRRQPSEHRSERSEQSKTARCASSPKRGLQVRGDTTIPRVPGPTWTPSTALTSEITTSPTCTRPLSRSTSRRAPSRLSR